MKIADERSTPALRAGELSGVDQLKHPTPCQGDRTGSSKTDGREHIDVPICAELVGRRAGITRSRREHDRRKSKRKSEDESRQDRFTHRYHPR
jgi:hypothetical protein